MVQPKSGCPGRLGRIGKGAALVSLLATLVLSASGSTRAASSTQTPRHGGVIMISNSTPLTTMDPAYTYGAPDWPQTHAIFSALLDFDNGTGIVPNVAQALPDVSADGLTYTFHLRHGVTF